MRAPLPSLTGLRAFEAAARHLSFTRAAAELNVTQAAISHQIRRLEEQLGLQLFVRADRTLTLTRAAQDYLPAIRTAFEDLHTATDRLRRRGGDKVLTVSTTPSMASKWLVPRLGAFQDAHPGIEVRIGTGTRLVDFRRDDVDIAIRYGGGSWPGVRAEWLMEVDIFPVCRPTLDTPTHPLRQPSDLAHHTLLHVDQYPDEWQLWLTAAGLPGDLSRRPGLTFDQSIVAMQAAMEGLGVALGRTPVADADLAAGRLIRPFDLTLPAEAGYYIVTPEHGDETQELALFRAWIMRSITPQQTAAKDQR